MSVEVRIKKRLGSFSLENEFYLESGVLGLLGASGCGKSLTLQCIAGIVKPDEGLIKVDGRTLFDSENHINLKPQQRNVGYLFQNYMLFPNMTIEQNIACGVREKRSKAYAVSEMMKKMELTGLEKCKPAQLSGGQQQRAALARILVGAPDILLLDEPMSALDSHLREQLLTELKQLLKSFGHDAIVVTHSRDEAYELCSSIAVMGHGTLAGISETHRMFADPGSRTAAAMTGCKNITAAKKAGETTVFVPQWGITLDAGRPVSDELCAIGIRAHFFSAGESKNTFPVHFVDEIEEPFGWIIKFRFDGQESSCTSVWWRMGKSEKPEIMPTSLGVAPKDILLLYS